MNSFFINPHTTKSRGHKSTLCLGVLVVPFLVCAALLFGSAQEFAATDAPQQDPVKTTFLVLYRPGPNWPPGKAVSELPLKDHFQYMLSLYGKGSMKFAGPLTDNAGGAVVLSVASESEAMAIVAEDPAIKAGIFVHEIHPWKLMPWEEYAKKQAQ